MESSEPNCSMHSVPHAESAVDRAGIRGVEFYFPRNYVSQEELEKFDGVGTGKYTNGLGQLEMAFCGDDEDVCSMAMTVTSALLKNYQVDPSSIGYLAVGTETLIDKSKSVKSTLMDLFPENANIQGADVKNACYGGTEALFGAVDWIRANHAYDGRMAIVVCVDIAIYAPGPARCTGGAGAIAFLLDVDAPLVIEPGLRVNYASNKCDFYKPVGGAQGICEYPVVDGSCSIDCYLTAAIATYSSLREAMRRNFNRELCLRDFHAILFHSPYTKLTHKALATLALVDFLHNSSADQATSPLVNGCGATTTHGTESDHPLLFNPEKLEALRNMEQNKWFARESMTTMVAAAQPLIARKLEPYVEFCRRLGNMYTPSLYAQLIGVLHKSVDTSTLDGQRLLLFSYGSGCIAAMFSLRFNNTSIQCRKSYEKMRQSVARAYERLDKRVKFAPEEYASALATREQLIRSDPPYTPVWSMTRKAVATNGDVQLENGTSAPMPTTASLFPGTFYLSQIDAKHRRFYAKTPSEQ